MERDEDVAGAVKREVPGDERRVEPNAGPAAFRADGSERTASNDVNQNTLKSPSSELGKRPPRNP